MAKGAWSLFLLPEQRRVDEMGTASLFRHAP